ncbi:MAG: DEAD/DEAH box helicase [Nitrososphaeria archaeon]
MKKFQELELSPRIKEGLFDAGLVETFPIQEEAIGPLLTGQDVIGQAKTGTGKTAAYIVPMLQKIDLKKLSLQALILAPTRELAVQITQEIRRLGKYTGVKVVTIYGGQAITMQIEALVHGVHIVVGTPGRVIDLINRGRLVLDRVQFVVLDEADTMLDMGFIEDVEYILNHTSSNRQTCLFSATMPERIIQLANKYMRQPKRILVDLDEPSVDTLDQYYTTVQEENKLSTLLTILEEQRPSSAIVFCATKNRTDKIAYELRRRHYNAASLHGDLSQSRRDYVMNLFRTKNLDVLVATDLACRGIDISHVECVINYNVPKYSLIYFHRVGRTARAGGKGKSFTLVSRMEYDDYLRIKHMTKAEIKPFYFGKSEPYYDARDNNRGYTNKMYGERTKNWRRNRGRGYHYKFDQNRRRN